MVRVIFVHQTLEDLRLGVHQFLGLPEGLRRTALDQVGGAGEGSAGESDQRHLQLPAQQSDSLHDKPRRLVRIGNGQPVDGLAAPDLVRQYRPMSLVELECRSHRLDRDEDVREEDGRVHAEEVHRLQGHLDAEFRSLAQFEKGHAAAHLLVFREIAAGLAHHPDRGVLGLFAAAGLEEGIVHGGHRWWVQGLSSEDGLAAWPPAASIFCCSLRGT